MDEPNPTPSSEGQVTTSIHPDTQALAVAYRWRLVGLMLWLIALFLLLPKAIAAGSGHLYGDHMGGFITAVNFPGPKVWATSFLQRSVGYMPASLGASTAIWALINVLAVWLMTMPVRGHWSAILIVARWLAVIGVGLVASLLFYQSSIGISWQPPELVYPVAALSVEFVATLFVYLYLARLAFELKHARIGWVLMVGGVAVAAVIGSAIFAVIDAEAIHANSRATRVQAVSALYGAVSVGLAVVMMGALLQLIPAMFRAAFPHGVGATLRADRSAEVRPVCGACGYDLRGLPEGGACPECGSTSVINQDEEQANRMESMWSRYVCCGLAFFVLIAFPLLYVVLHMPFRRGFGGTLPMLNFVGPKAWGVPALQRSIGYEPAWLGTDGALYCLISVLAVWLITWPHPVRVLDEKWHDLRRLARWTTAIAGGAFFGFAMISRGLYVNSEGFWKWLSAAVLLAEGPGTVLCYLYLARLARQYLAEREARLALWTARLAAVVMFTALFALVFDVLMKDDSTGKVLVSMTPDGVAAWGFAAVFGGLIISSGLMGFAVVLRVLASLLPLTMRGVPKLVIVEKRRYEKPLTNNPAN